MAMGKPRGKPTKSAQGYVTLMVLSNLIGIGLLVAVVIIARSTDLAENKDLHGRRLSRFDKLSSSITLALVRALQALLSTLSTVLLANVLTLLQWSIACQPQGLPYLSLLALSPSTFNWGLTTLLVSPAVRLSDRGWAALRLTLTALLWLSGLVLFFRTSQTVVYDTATTFSVSAGVGTFNASLVKPFIDYLKPSGYPFQILPFTYFAAVYILVLNPLISTIASPVDCYGPSCTAYLLSGGLEMVAPWSPPGLPDYDMIKINSAPSVQLDFTSGQSLTFSEDDCDVFGQSGVLIGIRFCVAADEDGPAGSLKAGIYVCSNGTENGACVGQTSLPNMTTSVAFYTRQATVVASRANYTIVSVKNVTAPVPVQGIDMGAYRDALRWLLNYTAADVPAPSSIAQSFWSSGQQLSQPTTFGILEQNFQSIIAFPFWLFNSNNWANPALQSNRLIEGMPPQFYTTASIVNPYDKVRFNSAMVYLFIALQGFALLFVLCVSVWSWWFRADILPKMSPYPLFDLAYKALVDVVHSGEDMSDMKNSDIPGEMRDIRVRAIKWLNT